MKCIIEKEIVIEKRKLDNQTWADICNSFEFFENKFVIFNKRQDDKITIREQKIRLEESQMMAFLDVMIDLKDQSNIDSIDYAPVGSTLVITFEVKPPLRWWQEGTPL